MADEIPDQIDVTGLKEDINEAIAATPLDDIALELIVSAEPYLPRLFNSVG